VGSSIITPHVTSEGGTRNSSPRWSHLKSEGNAPGEKKKKRGVNAPLAPVVVGCRCPPSPKVKKNKKERGGTKEDKERTTKRPQTDRNEKAGLPFGAKEKKGKRDLLGRRVAEIHHEPNKAQEGRNVGAVGTNRPGAAE